MQEIRSYGSVGVPAGNRRHYPETSGLRVRGPGLQRCRPPALTRQDLWR